MKKNHGRLIALMLVAFLVSGCGQKPQTDETKAPQTGETLYIFNYGDYMDPELIDAFEAETGITVKEDYFDTNEGMYPVVAGGQVKYDLVCASDYSIEKMIANDLLSELNYDNIPNSKYLDENCMKFMEASDPGNKYAIPYLWGTVGILYNTTMIEEGSVTGWKDLWNPEYKDDGILMQDSLRDDFMIAAMQLGYSMNTTDEKELQDIVDLLLEQSPIVTAWENDAARDTLIAGGAAIGVIYSGEYLYCLNENPDLDYVIPEEGTNVWFDCWVIPKNAQNKEAAEKFIDFMNRPENAAATFEYLTYPIPNTGGMELIDEEYRTNERIFPTEITLSKCDMYHYLGAKADELYASFWKQYRGN